MPLPLFDDDITPSFDHCKSLLEEKQWEAIQIAAMQMRLALREAQAACLIMEENEKVKALANDEDIDYYKTMFRWVEEMSNPANLHVCLFIIIVLVII